MNSDMKLKKQNSFIFLSTIRRLDALKRIEKIILENTFEQKKKRPGSRTKPWVSSANLPLNNWAQFVPIHLPSTYKVSI